jgi:hypothetical protein
MFYSGVTFLVESKEVLLRENKVNRNICDEQTKTNFSDCKNLGPGKSTALLSEMYFPLLPQSYVSMLPVGGEGAESGKYVDVSGK